MPSPFELLEDRAIGSNFTNAVQKMVSGETPSVEAVVRPTPPIFMKMIVLDVISDPNTELTGDRLLDFIRLGISNQDLAEVLPRNTIVAKKVGEDVNPMFVFPFFPSHLSLPCKPGECVWVMVEKPGADRMEIAYWFSRVVEPHVSDDVNHSHPNRSTESTMFPRTKDIHEQEKKGNVESGNHVWFELRNGPVMKEGNDRITSSEISILNGQREDVFERLITETRASSLMSYEAVPRFKKRPGDVVLEGSNNTLVVLGFERTGPISIDPAAASNAGSIDMVVGRGQTARTLGKEASTTSIKDAKGDKKGTELKKELNKSPDFLKADEGDPDMKNDRSRVLISQRTQVDKNFNIDIYNSKVGIDVSDSKSGEPAVVIKSDKVRLMARSDIEFIVTGYKEKSINEDKANVKVKDQKDSFNSANGRVNWASITIKSNGDIVFTPSDDGYIRLGGPDANLGVVCTDLPVKTVNGGIEGDPLISTMGGAFAGAAASPDGKSNSKVLAASGQGKFANKVLIK